MLVDTGIHAPGALERLTDTLAQAGVGIDEVGLVPAPTRTPITSASPRRSPPPPAARCGCMPTTGTARARRRPRGRGRPAARGRRALRRTRAALTALRRRDARAGPRRGGGSAGRPLAGRRAGGGQRRRPVAGPRDPGPRAVARVPLPARPAAAAVGRPRAGARRARVRARLERGSGGRAAGSLARVERARRASVPARTRSAVRRRGDRRQATRAAVHQRLAAARAALDAGARTAVEVAQQVYAASLGPEQAGWMFLEALCLLEHLERRGEAQISEPLRWRPGPDASAAPPASGA